MSDAVDGRGAFTSEQRHLANRYSYHHQRDGPRGDVGGSRGGIWQESGLTTGAGGCRTAADFSMTDYGAVGAEVGLKTPAIAPSMSSSSGAALLSKKTSGHSLKQSWRLKYQDFLPEKNAKHEPFQ